MIQRFSLFLVSEASAVSTDTQALALSRSIIARRSTKPQWDAGRAFLLPPFNVTTSLTDGNKSAAAQCQHQMEQIQIWQHLDATYSRTLTLGFQLLAVLSH